MHSTIRLLLGCAALPLVAPGQDVRPHVHIVATGGTIASTNYYSGNPGKIGVADLLKAVPAIDTIALVSGQQFSNIGSSAITPTMWLALSRVDIVYSYVGADGAAIDALVAAGAKGLVVDATGRGGMPPAQYQAVSRSIEKGVVVVVGSRTGAGTVAVGEGVRAGKPGTIGAGDLNAQKARVLLMLGLTRGSDAAVIAALFRANQ